MRKIREQAEFAKKEEDLPQMRLDILFLSDGRLRSPPSNVGLC